VHSHGSGMCGNGRLTEGGSAANYQAQSDIADHGYRSKYPPPMLINRSSYSNVKLLANTIRRGNMRICLFQNFWSYAAKSLGSYRDYRLSFVCDIL
jgi:hypothetical protein